MCANHSCGHACFTRSADDWSTVKRNKRKSMKRMDARTSESITRHQKQRHLKPVIEVLETGMAGLTQTTHEKLFMLTQVGTVVLNQLPSDRLCVWWPQQDFTRRLLDTIKCEAIKEMGAR